MKKREKYYYKLLKINNMNNNKEKKDWGALRMLYIRKRHYRYRGYLNRLNNCLAKILRTKGYDAWLETTKTL